MSLSLPSGTYIAKERERENWQVGERLNKRAEQDEEEEEEEEST